MKAYDLVWAGIAYWYSDSLRVGRSGDRIPVGGEIFRSRPDRLWGPPSLLYNGYRVSFPGVKRPGRGVDHPPSFSAEVKERVELYLYPPPSGPSWPVVGRNLPLPTTWYYIMLPIECLFKEIINIYLNIRLQIKWSCKEGVWETGGIAAHIRELGSG
jgi:hypothetical protein